MRSSVRQPIHLRIPRSVWTIVVCLSLLGVSSASSTRGSTPPLDPQDAETHWRQVGWMADLDDPCPNPGSGWTAPTQWDVGGERFCIYAFPAAPVTAQAILTLASQADLDALGPDRMAVAPMGVLDELLIAPQAARFLQQAGSHLLPSVGVPANVSLRLLDTRPDGLSIDTDIEENSPHGKTLHAFAHRFLCSTPPCLVDMQPRLALAYTEFHATDPTLATRDEIHGGMVRHDRRAR